MQLLPSEDIEIIWGEDVESGLRSGRLEFIAKDTFVRRNIFGDAKVSVTRDIIKHGAEYKAKFFYYEEEHFESTWYGQRAEAKVSFYRRRGEPILRARTSGDEVGLKLHTVGQINLK